MGTAILIANLINAASPGVAEIILMIKKTDGTVSIVTLLDQADAAFAANIQTAKAWMVAHPVKAV